MQQIKIIEEMQRQQWAMTLPSLRSMLAIVDGGVDVSADDYKYFHAIEQEQRANIVASFGRPIEGTLYSSVINKVGFIAINGPVIPRATMFSRVSGVASIDNLMAEFKAFENNPNIESIALMIDSPGGAVSGVSDFAAQIKASEKKTYSFSWMAASALYWIASATDEMITPPTGMVGSIGTILSMVDSSKADEKRGYRTIEIVSSQSPNKRIDPDSPESLQAIQKVIDDLATVFINTVAENRNVTPENVLENFGAGGLVVAEAALDAGMIDRLTDVESFIKGITQNKWSPVSAGTTAKGVTVSNSDNAKTLTVEELRSSYPDAVGTIEAAAKVAERERLQEIEALSDNFKNALPAVKQAVSAKIDASKYAEGATKASVSEALLAVVATAQTEAVAAVAKGPREAAAIVEKVAPATPPVEPNTEAESNARVNAMVQANKERGGR